ncbi:TlpA family protein disulfide reductase [Tamlana sp. s12]|uniref:TlpA disulfide reductase family protein n=1 Tax=Tamlana sp. s12 TaxID=1630406 RepID=UPI000800AC10|nr:TlpA disulfide reductase family protein [Tamlana sp. s12]OBQ54647.1 thioredoxin [Tamlana sp. s12]QQY82145.1 TlpA family protein disulfide reductase [Tamlana sp. s12]
MKLNVLFFAILIMASCSKVKKKEGLSQMAINESVQKKTQTKNDDLKIYDFDGFEKFLNQKDDKIHVINFWATWCGPCVKELPYFEKIHETYKDKNVEVLLVSLDFPHQYDSKLKPFIKDKKLKSKVIALDDPDMNTWIPKVDPSWSGALPATIIYKNDQSAFFEQSFTFESLEKEIKPFLK